MNRGRGTFSLDMSRQLQALTNQTESQFFQFCRFELSLGIQFLSIFLHLS
jgi:hypothetical protein